MRNRTMTRKTPLKRTPLKRTQIKTKPKKKSAKKKTHPPDSGYWQRKADELFMRQFRSEPCAACGERHGTVGHHIIPKSRSRMWRYERKNIIVLCPAHHTYGNDMAPHSFNSVAVGRWWAWFERTFHERMLWVEVNANAKFDKSWTYKEMFERLSGKPAILTHASEGSQI